MELGVIVRVHKMVKKRLIDFKHNFINGKYLIISNN